MQSKKGCWKISTGKGSRIYINCDKTDGILHPQELCNNNGLGLYDYQDLKDLAIAIILFEKEKQKN